MRQRIFAHLTRVLSLVFGDIVDSQYLTGSGLSGGHSAISHSSGRLPSGWRGMCRLAGRMRMARRWLRIAAVGLFLVFLLPVRQVIRRQALRPAASASSRKVEGLWG